MFYEKEYWKRFPSRMVGESFWRWIRRYLLFRYHPSMISLGRGNYIKYGSEITIYDEKKKTRVRKNGIEVIGFTNTVQVGPIVIHFYWKPVLLRLYRHLKDMDERFV